MKSNMSLSLNVSQGMPNPSISDSIKKLRRCWKRNNTAGFCTSCPKKTKSKAYGLVYIMRRKLMRLSYWVRSAHRTWRDSRKSQHLIYSTSSIQDRYLGYYKSLLEHHFPLRSEYIINDRDEHGAFVDISLPDDMPSAFVCNCDQVAYNLIQTLQEKGFKVPEDCSVVGFDNDIYATLSKPGITTMDVDIEEMSRVAVTFIINKLHDPSKSYGRMFVKGHIVYRDSVKRKAQLL